MLNIKSNNNDSMANTWKQYYDSEIPEFHKGRRIEHNGYELEVNAKKLCMAKQVCSDWAFLLNQEIIFSDDYKKVEEFYKPNLTDWTNFLEGAFATGRALAICVKENNTDDLTNSDLYLLDKSRYNILANGNYEIELTNNEQLIIDVETNQYKIINTETNVTETYQLNYKAYKEIVLLKDITYLKGKSIYADALDILKEIDMTFTEMMEDREFAKPMILASNDAYMTNVEFDPAHPEEKPKIVQWLNKANRLFKGYSSKDLGQSDKPMPIEKITFQMQEDKYINTLNMLLSLLSKKCKFGDNYYSFDKETRSVYTATEVIDKNSELARNFKNFRDIYKQFLKEFYEQISGQELKETFCYFGDGIFTNDKYEREMALEEISVITSPDLEVEYLVKFKQWKEEEAKKAIDNKYNDLVDIED